MTTPTTPIPAVHSHRTSTFQRICNLLSIASFIGVIALWIGTRKALQSMADQFAVAFDAANGPTAGAPAITIEFNPFTGILSGLANMLGDLFGAIFSVKGLIVVLLIVVAILAIALVRTRRNTTITP